MKNKIWMVFFGLSLALQLAGRQSNAADWSQFNSPEGQFSAQFPTPPEHRVIPEKTPVGTIDENIFQSNSPAGNFIVEYSRLPGIATALGGTESILNKSIKAFVEKGGNQELGVTEITVDNFPGKELSFKDAQGLSGKARFILAKKLKILYVLSAKGASGDDPIQNFFTSFKINSD